MVYSRSSVLHCVVKGDEILITDVKWVCFGTGPDLAMVWQGPSRLVPDLRMGWSQRQSITGAVAFFCSSSPYHYEEECLVRNVRGAIQISLDVLFSAVLNSKTFYTLSRGFSTHSS